jgi:hypothetical protein
VGIPHGPSNGNGGGAELMVGRGLDGQTLSQILRIRGIYRSSVRQTEIDEFQYSEHHQQRVIHGHWARMSEEWISSDGECFFRVCVMMILDYLTNIDYSSLSGVAR